LARFGQKKNGSVSVVDDLFLLRSGTAAKGLADGRGDFLRVQVNEVARERKGLISSRHKELGPSKESPMKGAIPKARIHRSSSSVVRFQSCRIAKQASFHHLEAFARTINRGPGFALFQENFPASRDTRTESPRRLPPRRRPTKSKASFWPN